MARQKQRLPLQREPSDFSQGPPETPSHGWKGSNGVAGSVDPPHANGSIKAALAPVTTERAAGLPQLIICVGGIYISFLSWAFLQERITTTTYGSPSDPQRFTYSIFLNTIQSVFGAISGSLYLYFSTLKSTHVPAVFPSRRILGPLLLVAITSSLASPFGYASLAHIDYITFILAKACKLLPVMFLQVTLFRRPYPLYKYIVVALVTAGVAVFTLHHDVTSSKKHSKSSSNFQRNNAWGLLLLSINLLFDGLTNSTQDHIFTTHRSYSGPQMMVAQNILSTLFTASYLLLAPLFPLSLSTMLSLPPTNELSAASSFLRAHPAVLKDVLGFAACGAVGQIFIYYTLAQFSSLLLVTVTVTRKMLTMVLSVVWFGHRLGKGQWVGVGLVFGGIGAEAWIARREKVAKEAEKRRRAVEEGKKVD